MAGWVRKTFLRRPGKAGVPGNFQEMTLADQIHEVGVYCRVSRALISSFVWESCARRPKEPFAAIIL